MDVPGVPRGVGVAQRIESTPVAREHEHLVRRHDRLGEEAHSARRAHVVAGGERVVEDERQRLAAAREVLADREAQRQKLRDSDLKGRDLAAYQRRIFELAVIAYFKDPAKVVELAGFRLVERVQKGIWESLGDYDLRSSLQRLEVSAVVLHGKDDVIPCETAKETAECLRAEFTLIPDCGRVPYVEGKETFVRVIDAFLPRT